MPLQHSLIPTRFAVLCAHLTSMLIVFWTRKKNINATLELDEHEHVPHQLQSDYDSLNTTVLTVLCLSLICFIIHFAGLVSSSSTFRSGPNMYFVVNHGVAACLLSALHYGSWEVSALWIIFICCNVLPLMLEIIIFIKMFYLVVW